MFPKQTSFRQRDNAPGASSGPGFYFRGPYDAGQHGGDPRVRGGKRQKRSRTSAHLKPSSETQEGNDTHPGFLNTVRDDRDHVSSATRSCRTGPRAEKPIGMTGLERDINSSSGPRSSPVWGSRALREKRGSWILLRPCPPGGC